VFPGEPPIWIQRLVIVPVRRPGVNWIRNIEFRRGLNVINTKVTQDTESTAFGHNVGKTLLVRMIRYALGDEQYASQRIRSRIRERIREGSVLAVVRVKGSTWCVAMQAKRDEQIGHMEALQDLFKEALHCARLPFGIDQDGTPIQAEVVHSVGELADHAYVADLPTYEELLPLFSDHVFATEEGVKALREHDRSAVIAAANDAYDRPLVLYGADLIDQQKKEGKTSVKSVVFPVGSFSELQFIIAAIAKFVGVPSTSVQCHRVQRTLREN
jgi:hypothetical protein